MNKNEIIKRLDGIIKECLAVKNEMQKDAALELFNDGTDLQRQVDKNKLYTGNALKVIDHLSNMRIKHKLGVKKLHVTRARIKTVSDRLRDSSVEEAIDVIDTRFHEWIGDTQFEQYLTLETMFRPSKYAKYVDDVDRVKKLMVKSSHESQGFWAE